MTDQVRRDIVKLGLDFRAIPVDIGDGIEWEFHPDPAANAIYEPLYREFLKLYKAHKPIHARLNH